MTTSAQAVMAETVKRFTFIAPQDEQFVIKGHGAEGGALWTVAQELYKGCKWEDDADAICFNDGSFIQFNREFDSIFSSSYKACGGTTAPAPQIEAN